MANTSVNDGDVDVDADNAQRNDDDDNNNNNVDDDEHLVYGPSLVRWLAFCAQQNEKQRGARSLLSDARYALLLANINNGDWQAPDRFAMRRLYKVYKGRLLHKAKKDSKEPNKTHYQLSESMAHDVLEHYHAQAHRRRHSKLASGAYLAEQVNEKYWRVSVEQAQFWVDQCPMCRPRLPNKRARSLLEDERKRTDELELQVDRLERELAEHKAIVQRLSDGFKQAANMLGLENRVCTLMIFAGCRDAFELVSPSSDAEVDEFLSALDRSIAWLVECKKGAQNMHDELAEAERRLVKWTCTAHGDKLKMAVDAHVVQHSLTASVDRLYYAITDPDVKPDNTLHVLPIFWSEYWERRLVDLQKRRERVAVAEARQAEEEQQHRQQQRRRTNPPNSPVY